MAYRYEPLVTIHLPLRATMVAEIIKTLRDDYSADELVVMEQEWPSQRDGGEEPDANILIIAKRTPA
jgi:hypothetical protein